MLFQHRLLQIKVIKCRDIDYETAKKAILGYFKRKGEAWPDEAATDLELDYDLVMKSIESCAALKPGFLSADNA
jgi:hypothetical protein